MGIIGFGRDSGPVRIRMPSPPQKMTTFTDVSLAGLEDLEPGQRDDELAAPVPDVAELIGDLVPEVPGHDQDVVRPLLRESLRRVDRDVGAREEPALFERVAVDGERDLVGADT